MLRNLSTLKNEKDLKREANEGHLWEELGLKNHESTTRLGFAAHAFKT